MLLKCLKIRQLDIIKKKKVSRFRKSLAKDIKIFLTKKKNKKREYCRERYRNLLETEKQRLVEYRKDIMKCEKIKTYYEYKKIIRSFKRTQKLVF